MSLQGLVTSRIRTRVYYIFFFCFISAVNVRAQTNNTIVAGIVDSVHSHVLKEKRKIWVHVPVSSPGQRYPVIYLLDGDDHFYSVLGIMQQLSSVNGNTVLPEMIIVGIPNTNRTRDLTPSHSAPTFFADSAFVSNSGGNEKFISFIEKELIPHIDSLYPTAPYRVFIGHSLGGLTVINTLLNHTDLFNAYISIDPSMWWDNQKLLKQSNKIFSGKTFDKKSLFLGAANTINKNSDTLRVQSDTNIITLHMRSILQLGKLLNNSRQNQLQTQWKYYENDDHGSVPLIATYDGLRFIFSFHKFQLSFSDFANTALSLDSLIKVHYTVVSTKMGYEVLPQEALVNGLANAIMKPNRYKQALGLFKMNAHNYPGSFYAQVSMGDFYNLTGNKVIAIGYYSKALTIRNDPDVKLKIEKLKKGKE